MSDHQNENASRIAAYLENKLSPEEREAFKRRLSEDDDLRLQYVDALMNRAGSSGGGAAEPEPEAVVAPAPEPVVMHEPEAEVTPEPEAVVTPEPLVMEGSAPEVSEAPGPEDEESAWPEEGKRVRVGFLGSGWIVAITLLLLIISGVVMFLISRHQDSWDKTVAAMAADSGGAKKVTRVDSAAVQASIQPAATPVSPVDGVGTGGGMGKMGDSLFANLYKPYARGDDPIELNQYYQDYRKENFAAVLAKGDSPALGVGKRAVLIRDYMRLYVGLSSLATGDAGKAVTELEAVVRRTKPGDILYETARWYLALAWLKRNDVDSAEARGKALELARNISHGYSRYREPAMRLILALKS
jgi:hypothetical protein